ncbi:MAG TPA: hypothetical protein PKA64_14325 [Myxococcota bacterium]|nr:hypothetical protein [Myxococcota bacterium]
MPLPLSRQAAAIALAAGCTQAPAIEIGTGDLDFVPLTPGQEIEVIRGPQGGYHVLASVRTRGVEPGDPENLASPDNPEVRFRVTVEGEDITLTGAYRQGLDTFEADGGWTHQMVGRLCILDIPDDDVLAGRSIHFDVRLLDATGLELTDGRELIAVPHPLNL